MRKTGSFFVNGGHVHLALRDLRREFGQPKAVAAIAGVAAVMGISGPFGTLEAFGLATRMAYWALVVPATYAAGFLGSNLIHPYLPSGPRAIRIALAALASAMAVAMVLALLNSAIGLDLGGPASMGLGFIAVYAICLVIETVGFVLRAPQAKGNISAAPAILARLPLHKRGTVLALCAQDHYTTIITTKGREMVLMRLSDAIAECAPVQGLQIHRSHWVALAAVAQITRAGDGAEVTLTSGDTLPIARARMHDARAAGLLARKGD